MSKQVYSRRRHEIAESRAQFGEILTAMQPTAASHSAWVATHQEHTNLNVGHVKAGSIRGACVKSPSRGPNLAKYSLRCSLPPHPTQLGSPRTKHIPAETVSMSKHGNFEAASEIAESRAQYGETLTAMQPTATSHSTWVATHQTHANVYGERVRTGYFRGGVVKSRFLGPIWRKTQCEPPHRRVPLSLGRHEPNTYQPRR